LLYFPVADLELWCPMDVHKSSLLAVFDAKQRLEVPLFQRQYVWHEEQQWLPLWEDIERKFVEALDGRKDAPVHFLGAMVLDQKQTPTGHVVLRQIIDGQQRLTALQIFLAAYRDFCKEQECMALAAECDKFLFNTGMMADKEIDRFKVWPTQLDRLQFTDVIAAGSREELLKRHPLRRRPYARKSDPRPRMVEAYLFFFDQLVQFFLGEEGAPPLAADHPLVARVDECFQTLRNALMVVVIDLQKDDDPQVIFETLNARGEPLLPADLLRNYVFIRAIRADLDIEATYAKYWARFDDEFWREEVKQGRLTRPRSDLFIQHFLASRQGQDIPIKHLYAEYKHWIESTRPFGSVVEELAALARQGEQFRRIVSPTADDTIFPLCTFLEAYDIRTAYPLLLALLDADLSENEWLEISEILESYLLRRAVCNLGTKNYNRVFLTLTRNLRNEGFSAASLKKHLLTQTGESNVWPDDTTFREAWLHKPLYGPLNSPKLIHLFGRLNQTFMSAKSERVVFADVPTVEHIMPQTWIENWPLADGSQGMNFMALAKADVEDGRAASTRKREVAIQTLGNLTILSSALNSAQSNLPWKQKGPELMKHSLLPINQNLAELKVWNEESILDRAEDHYARAVRIWAR
jgi:uncharacterized protein with ParB-like and HNH nuclease domain